MRLVRLARPEALALLLAASPVGAVASDAPEVREVHVVGASAYGREAILRIVRLDPGDRLRREAAEVASVLENRYHDDGYIAARVQGSFDPEDGRLTLAVDEGLLAAVSIEGLSARAAARAREEARLETGGLLRREDVEEALSRLERASGGAVVRAAEPAYAIAASPEGARLALRFEKRAARAGLSLRPPAATPVYDRVDGVAPWLGGEAFVHDAASYDHLSLYARGSYGFASRDARFVLGARRPFGRGRVTLGYEFHDLTDSDDLFRGPGFQESLRTLLFRASFRDYFRRRGHEAYAFARLSARAQLGLGFRSDVYESVTAHADGTLFHRSRTPRAIPAVDEGRIGSLVATLRLSSREPLFGDASSERESFLDRSLYGLPADPVEGVRLEGSFELASPGALGGEFSFRRFIGRLRAERPVAGRLSVGPRLLLGLTRGSPPVQKRFALGGCGALPGYDFKEFPGEKVALATLEWTYHTPPPWPAPAVFYDAGVAWGRGSAGRGWSSDVGIALKWPGEGRVVVRVTLAFALGRRDRTAAARR